MRLIDADMLKTSFPCGESVRTECVRATIDHAPDAIARCCECKSWDDDSGLTARMCYEWCKFTTQYEFCSRGRKKCD